MKKLAFFIVAALVVTGCVSKQELGGIGGAGAGALLCQGIGSGYGNTAAMIVCGIGGGIVGSRIGAALDADSERMANEHLQSTMEHGKSGVTKAWQNPDAGTRGSITPQMAYTKNGTNCRNFTGYIQNSNGTTETIEGTVCRNNHGVWH